ncbi:MAG: helix-turn-helix domain-containing protein [Candidatus Omnitrophota bacterium]
MAEEKLLNIRDVAAILGISEKEVIDLAETGQIPAYKIGGVYLRFKRQQIEEYRKRLGLTLKRNLTSHNYLFKDKLNDFLYFNDFYILSAIIILLIIFIIFQGY